LVPIGISWLHLIAPWRGTTIQLNTYLRPSTITSNLTIFKSSDHLTLTPLQAWQCPDLYGCQWPPDTFTIDSGIPKSYWNESHKLRRNLYLRLLYEQSTTQKVGYWWHVPGALYTWLSKNALVISPSIDGAHDIVVRIQESDIETWGPSPQNGAISPPCANQLLVSVT
jgi:hypothetical protein